MKMNSLISIQRIMTVGICAFFLLPFSSNANTNYPTNKEPLMETPFTPLPLGSVKADGWLLTQLQLQKDGLTGYAEALYNHENDLGPNNDWLGGSGDSWERAPYYVKGLIPLAYTLDDEELIEKSQKWMNWSLDNQQSNGFFGPANNRDWWARIPMLYAIRDFYEATNDARVIPFFTKYFQYQNTNISSRPLSDWGRSRAGDNIELVFWLYNRTGDGFLLNLADKLKNQAYNWTDIFTNNRFMAFERDFQPKHNVNVPQASKMPVIYYQKSKNEADKDAYHIGREHLMCDHGQPAGMQSGNEMLAGRSSLTGIELCTIVEEMQSSETIQMILGDVSVGDRLEKVTFNALPGIMTDDIRGMQYYTQVNQVKSVHGNGHFGQNYDNGLTPSPESGYGCCRFNMHMGWPYFVKTMWAATADNGLAAMAYGPGEVTAKVADGVEVSIKEITDYPFGEEIRFVVSIGQTTAFPLKLRIPTWCNAPTVYVNGEVQTGVVAGEFYEITRAWNNGDQVVLNVPMHIQLNEEVNKSVSVQRGPLVYSLKIEEEWNSTRDFAYGFKEYQVLPLSEWNYGLEIDQSDLENAFEVVKTGTMPANPFEKATAPVTLKVNARRIPEWGYIHGNMFACDPPYGPVESTQPTEKVTLVPFGSGSIRLTCIPLIGTPVLTTDNFQEDFNSSSNTIGWVHYNGSFIVDNGELLATSIEGGYSGSKSIQTSTHFSDFIYDFKIKVGDRGDGGVIFRADHKSGFGDDSYNGYYAGINAENGRVILGKANGNWTSLREVPMSIAANVWHQVRVEAKGTSIKIYVNDMNTPKITYTDRSFSSGMIGVRCYNAITRWDDLSVRIWSDETSLKSSKNRQGIKISPNPAHDFIDIFFDEEQSQGYKVNIFNTTGSLIDSKIYDKGVVNARIDTQHLALGTYILKVFSDMNEYESKFIKQ